MRLPIQRTKALMPDTIDDTFSVRVTASHKYDSSCSAEPQKVVVCLLKWINHRPVEN